MTNLGCHPGVLMFIALVPFAAFGDPSGRVLKPELVKPRVSGRVACPVDSAEPEATTV